jgi:hypothetical protein
MISPHCPSRYSLAPMLVLTSIRRGRYALIRFPRRERLSEY